MPDTATPIWRWSAEKTAAAVTSRAVSAAEVTDAHLARMAAVNPKLNAVTVETADKARARAKAIDAALAAGIDPGPLAGVPITIKENVDVAGEATPNGVAAYADLIAPADAPLVRNLLDAGAVILGRTNTPEFSFRAFTDNPLRGLTLNPWRDDITCGGSSGGGGSAVAAGIGAIAHGNDIGGSLRYPAYCNGIATVRPTLGRVPAYNPSQMAERPLMMQLMSVQGPMARTVADVRIGLEVMAGRSADDPWYAPAPIEHARPKEKVPVAMTVNAHGRPFHPAVRQAVETAAAHLEAAGHPVEAVDPPDIIDVYQTRADLIFTEFHHAMEPAVRQHGSPAINKVIDGYLAFSNVLDLPGYIAAAAKRTTLLRRWMQFMERYPIVLTPLSLQPPFPVGEDEKGNEAVKAIFDSLIYQASMNLLGLPGAVVPVLVDDGIPIGVQIVTQRYGEGLALDAAEVIERQVGVLTDRLLAGQP